MGVVPDIHFQRTSPRSTAHCTQLTLTLCLRVGREGKEDTNSVFPPPRTFLGKLCNG